MEQPTKADMDIPLKQVRPIVLGVLQNQWFYHPARIIAAIDAVVMERGDAAGEKYRRKIIEHALFAGCKSGRNLRAFLGDHWCDRIVWENASRRIGDFSSAVFPADIPHLERVLADVRPDIVVTFGKVATEAFTRTRLPVHRSMPDIHIQTCHPAARGDVASDLRMAKAMLTQHSSKL